ncbi:hypothetical protein NC651_024372 [Populus alba x Populus x berolinensis]|nr:hypothetical protein NC651_024372 [Populus alba x Populus x berolinensis]
MGVKDGCMERCERGESRIAYQFVTSRREYVRLRTQAKREMDGWEERATPRAVSVKPGRRRFKVNRYKTEGKK